MTESLWASVCSPEMGSGSSQAEAPASTADPDSPADPHAGCASPERSEAPDSRQSKPDSDEPHCPLVALGSAGTCVPASLPARAADQPSLAGEREVLTPRMDSAPPLLFSAPPFHPPKA